MTDTRTREAKPIASAALAVPGEADAAFFARRAEEERRQIGASSCVVRSVHEDLLEAYEDAAAAETKAEAGFAALLNRLDATATGEDEPQRR